MRDKTPRPRPQKDSPASGGTLSASLFLAWLCVLTLMPFVVVLVMSFLQRDAQGALVWAPTLHNYVRCFQWTYVAVLLKTLCMALGATLACLILGFHLAYFLAKQSGWLKNIGLILLFVPFWTNFILRVYAMVSLLGNHGLLNQAGQFFGLWSQPLPLLHTRWGVWIGLIYNYVPFLVVPVFSALDRLDPVLREAAFDLGANRWQTFWKVVIPNVRSGIFVGCAFVFVPVLGEYVIPDLLGGAKEVYLGNVLVSQLFTMQDWPMASTIASLLCLTLLGVLVVKGRGEALRSKIAYA